MSTTVRIVVTDYIESDLEWERQQCAEMHTDLTVHQMKRAESAELIEVCRDADILVVNTAEISSGVMNNLDAAKVIIRHGVGFDNLDVEAATGQGIICAYEPTASTEDVAEQAIMLMFALYRKIHLQLRLFDRLVENGTVLTGQVIRDTVHPIHRMGGKILGIVGCGHIGSLVLRKMSGFGMRLLVSDPYLSPERKRALGIEHTPLETLLRTSDIVTLHVPLTVETTGMINTEALELMKPSAILVNTARSKIIQTADLADALRRGVIAGAAIDVHTTEPPKEDYSLLGLDNVLLTPHLAWYSEEGGWDIRHMIMGDIRRVLDGGLPAHVLNPEVLDHPNCRLGTWSP